MKVEIADVSVEVTALNYSKLESVSLDPTHGRSLINTFLP